MMPEIDTLRAMSYLDFDFFNLNLSLFRYNPPLMHKSYKNTNPSFDEKDQISYTAQRYGKYKDFSIKITSKFYFENGMFHFGC